MSISKNEMRMAVSFPLTVDDFLAYPKLPADCEPDESCRKAAEILVGIVNNYYDKGLKGARYRSVYEVVERAQVNHEELKGIIEEMPAFFQLADLWCERAYEAGRETAEQEQNK